MRVWYIGCALAFQVRETSSTLVTRSKVLENMDKKSKQLGMNYSTACYRLDRIVLFGLLKELGRLTCFRCGQLITTPQHLSMDHVMPWMGNANNLFWDLNNISWSHRGCNSAAARPAPGNIKKAQQARSKHDKGPDGMLWCSGHQTYLDGTLFDRNRSSVTGFQYYCRDCRAAGK